MKVFKITQCAAGLSYKITPNAYLIGIVAALSSAHIFLCDKGYCPNNLRIDWHFSCCQSPVSLHGAVVKRCVLMQSGGLSNNEGALSGNVPWVKMLILTEDQWRFGLAEEANYSDNYSGNIEVSSFFCVCERLCACWGFIIIIGSNRLQCLLNVSASFLSNTRPGAHTLQS